MKRKVVALLTALSLIGGLAGPYGFVETQAAETNVKKEAVQSTDRNVINFNTDWHYKKVTYREGKRLILPMMNGYM